MPWIVNQSKWPKALWLLKRNICEKHIIAFVSQVCAFNSRDAYSGLIWNKMRNFEAFEKSSKFVEKWQMFKNTQIARIKALKCIARIFYYLENNANVDYLHDFPYCTKLV